MRYVVTTQSTDLHVRSGPGMNYPVVDRLARGAVVDVALVQGEWAKLAIARWVSKVYLRPAGATTTPPAGLQLVARSDLWLVFSRFASRREVMDYLWEPGFDATSEELYSRSDGTRRPSDIDFGDTHWAIAQTVYITRPDLYRRMRAGIEQQIAGLANRSANGMARPDWVPLRVWNQFLAVGVGVHRYPRSSSFQTDIILIKRQDNVLSGYAELPVHEATLSRLMRVIPASTFQRLLGAETGQQAFVRWLAEVNARFNTFIKLEIERGTSIRQAIRNYNDMVHMQWVAAFIPLVSGSTTPHPAGAQAGDIIRAWRSN